MKIQLLSDLHLEFSDYEYQSTDADVVIFAGDIHTKDRGVRWAVEVIRDKPVIYVLGNHEYYGRSYPKFIGEARNAASGSQVHVLENEYICIDGVNFLGCTLWTDFAVLEDPKTAGFSCQQVMTDYRKIRRSEGYSKIRSIDTALIHARSRKWLENTLAELSDQKNIVISHHGPHMNSVEEYRRNDVISSAYVSDLTDIAEVYAPEIWVHGHLHNTSNYLIGTTRVLCNPKGYAGEENPDFNPEFTFNV